MSVFQLLNSPVSEIDGAAKLFDIQTRPIRTKRTIYNAREMYSSKNIPRDTRLTDVYPLRVAKVDMIVSHSTYRNLINKRDKITTKSGRSEYESAFMFGAVPIRKELPTDIINGIFYYNRNDNSINIDYPLIQGIFSDPPSV